MSTKQFLCLMFHSSCWGYSREQSRSYSCSHGALASTLFIYFFSVSPTSKKMFIPWGQRPFVYSTWFSAHYLKHCHFIEEYNRIRLLLRKIILAILWNMDWGGKTEERITFMSLLSPRNTLLFGFWATIITWFDSYLSRDSCHSLLPVSSTLENPILSLDFYSPAYF